MPVMKMKIQIHAVPAVAQAIYRNIAKSRDAAHKLGFIKPVFPKIMGPVMQPTIPRTTAVSSIVN